MAVFADAPGGPAAGGAPRAVRGARLALATHEFRAWLDSASPTAACRRSPSASACTPAR
jgi:hypothetical protein